MLLAETGMHLDLRSKEISQGEKRVRTKRKMIMKDRLAKRQKRSSGAFDYESKVHFFSMERSIHNITLTDVLIKYIF